VSSGAVWLHLHFTLSELLAPVDGRFTEGFDTLDLNKAKGARGAHAEPATLLALTTSLVVKVRMWN
jgi:hypothetical protein